MAIAIVYVVGLRLVPPDMRASANPCGSLVRERRAAASFAAAVAVAIYFAAAVGFPLLYGIAIGAACGIAYGVVLATIRTAWPTYMIARTWLALRGEIPWRLTGFLEEAHKKGILRQAGTRYQFRHMELQRYLIRRYPWMR